VKKSILSIACWLALGPLGSDAAARCLAYEPTRVTLEGTLTSRSLPGPPNYVSIARGDHPETIFLVTLDQPICVSADPSSRMNARSHAGITEVQLAPNSQRPRRFVDKRVRVSGSLFGAQSRHHRTPVVLNVTGIRAVGDDAGGR